jgi:protein gp37
MAETTGISWTDMTFNPWIGCTKVSPACAHCYAERDFDHRYHKVTWGPSGTRVLTSDSNWKNPLKWNLKAGQLGIRKRVFCASLADVFEDWNGPITDNQGLEVKQCKNCLDYYECDDNQLGCLQTRYTMDDVRKRLFQLIDATPNLDWLILTKRPENIRRMYPELFTHSCGEPNPNWIAAGAANYKCKCGGVVNRWFRANVWLGTSVENQEYADKRTPELIKCRDLAPVLFLSAEPLLGPIDLYRAHVTNMPMQNGPEPTRVDWLVVGGESGDNARPVQLEWIRSLKSQCDAKGVAFHMKQLSQHGTKQYRDFDKFPKDLQVRAFPQQVSSPNAIF